MNRSVIVPPKNKPSSRALAERDCRMNGMGNVAPCTVGSHSAPLWLPARIWPSGFALVAVVIMMVVMAGCGNDLAPDQAPTNVYSRVLTLRRVNNEPASAVVFPRYDAPLGTDRGGEYFAGQLVLREGCLRAEVSAKYDPNDPRILVDHLAQRVHVRNRGRNGAGGGPTWSGRCAGRRLRPAQPRRIHFSGGRRAGVGKGTVGGLHRATISWWATR